MAANPHCNHFRHPGSHHVPNRRSPEVVEESAAQTSLLTGFRPTLTKIVDTVPRFGIDEDPGDDFSPLSLKAEHPRALCLHGLQQLPVEVDYSALFVLGRARI